MDVCTAERGWSRDRAAMRLRRPVWGALLVLASGCVATPPVVERAKIENTTLGPVTVAVAPALNLSGGSDFDVNKFADLMASEWTFVDDVRVVPVSRVLGVLSAQGRTTVESPEHALELAKLVGADAILVFAITEYDPYDPPSIGISAQLYGARRLSRGGAVDPVALSRQASLAGSTRASHAGRVLAACQRVIDASHGAVEQDVRRFAALRGGGGSPYGWRKFMVNQQDYIRYCCFVTIVELVSDRDDPNLAEESRER